MDAAIPLHTSNVMFLHGGGRSPRYPPNKVVVWDDSIGSEVAELEFRERVRGMAGRREWLAVALRRRVVVFKIGETVSRYAEYDSGDNKKGRTSITPHALAYASSSRPHRTGQCDPFDLALHAWAADGSRPSSALATMSA